MKSASTPLSSHIDLFSGCGGMSLGFQLAGFNARVKALTIGRVQHQRRLQNDYLVTKTGQ